MINFRKVLNSKAFINGIWLYLLQAVNTIIPLITIPIVTRALGPSNFGIFSFSLNLITYLQVFVEYGFTLTGIRKFNNLDTREEKIYIYRSITSAKIFLLFVSLIILVLISFVFRFSSLQYKTIFMLFFVVVGTSLQQNWYFQAVQELKTVTILNIIIRFLSTLGIYFYIKNPEHILLYSFLYSMTFFISGLINIRLVNRSLKTNFMFSNIASIVCELKDGWDIFTTQAFAKIFSGVGITVLGFFYSSRIVGGYSAIQKIPQLILTVFLPISQILYPYSTQKFKHKSSRNFIKKLFIVLMIILLPIIIMAILNSKYIIYIIFGENYVTYYTILIPLLIWTMFSIINNILGIQILVASGNEKIYAYYFRITMIMTVIFTIIFGYYLEMIGVALSLLICELILTIQLSRQVYILMKGRK